MNTKTLYFIIALCLLLPFSRLASQNLPTIQHYTIDDGLPHNVVYDILQDKKGYLWLGTDDGLVRFDGRNFKTYTTEDGLLSNYIISLQEADDSTLWVGSWKGGVNCLKNDSVFTPAIDITTKNVLYLSLRGNRVILSGMSPIPYQKSGDRWRLVTQRANYWMYAQKDSTPVYQVPIYLPINQTKYLRGINKMRGYASTDQSFLYFGDLAGVWRYQNDTTFTPFYPEIIQQDTIFHISQDRQNNYWLGGRGKITRIDAQGKATYWTKNLPDLPVYEIKMTSTGKLY